MKYKLILIAFLATACTDIRTVRQTDPGNYYINVENGFNIETVIQDVHSEAEKLCPSGFVFTSLEGEADSGCASTNRISVNVRCE